MRDIAGFDVAARVELRMSFSEAELARFTERVEAAVERVPRDPSVVPTAAGLAVRVPVHGIEVNATQLRRQLVRALTDIRASRRIRVPAVRIPPTTTAGELKARYPKFVTVDRSGFRLRLYENLKLVRTYTIAVGAIGYDTPAGLYRIQNKAVNPVWNVPHSPWTGSLAGAVIPPGPSNPLKARWLGIYGGAGIHGTDQTWSLGSAASHGCIRMAIPDVIELYDRVEVGTPVYIG